MEYGCPVCNGLTDISINCPRCRGEVVDEGSIDNFLGPYSPYEEHDLYHMISDDQEMSRCVHLAHCPACGEDFRVGIQRIRM